VTASDPGQNAQDNPCKQGAIHTSTEDLALLRKAAARTVDDLWTAIGRLIDAFTPQECANYFAASGYAPD